MVDKLLAVAGRLGRFPERGRVVPELDDPTIRECFVYIYRVQGDAVLVAAVVHGRRLLDPLVEQIIDS